MRGREQRMYRRVINFGGAAAQIWKGATKRAATGYFGLAERTIRTGGSKSPDAVISWGVEPGQELTQSRGVPDPG